MRRTHQHQPAEALLLDNTAMHVQLLIFTCGAAAGVADFQPAGGRALKAAVGEWCSSEAGATAKYGKIAEWDVSKVTSMEQLFFDQASCTGDLSSWDTAQVS